MLSGVGVWRVMRIWMMKHLRYLKYVLLHKWYVFLAGRKTGVSLWRLLIHDFSKFSRVEWKPYVDKFYGDGGERDQFDVAWNHHQKANSHHWQYWVEPEHGNFRMIEMPEQDVFEMVADWAGAGRGITGESNPTEWYEEQYQKIMLHPRTRILVEIVLAKVYDRDFRE